MASKSIFVLTVAALFGAPGSTLAAPYPCTPPYSSPSITPTQPFSKTYERARRGNEIVVNPGFTDVATVSMTCPDPNGCFLTVSGVLYGGATTTCTKVDGAFLGPHMEEVSGTAAWQPLLQTAVVSRGAHTIVVEEWNGYSHSFTNGPWQIVYTLQAP